MSHYSFKDQGVHRILTRYVLSLPPPPTPRSNSSSIFPAQGRATFTFLRFISSPAPSLSGILFFHQPPNECIVASEWAIPVSNAADC